MDELKLKRATDKCYCLCRIRVAYLEMQNRELNELIMQLNQELQHTREYCGLL